MTDDDIRALADRLDQRALATKTLKRKHKDYDAATDQAAATALRDLSDRLAKATEALRDISDMDPTLWGKQGIYVARATASAILAAAEADSHDAG